MSRRPNLVAGNSERAVEMTGATRAIAGQGVVAAIETVTWGGKMPNAGKTQQLRITGVWKNQQGRWQEIARHASIVAAP